MADATTNSGSQDAEEMRRQARSLIAGLTAAGVPARLLGGLAIALRCPAANPPSPLARAYSDFDIVASGRKRRELTTALAEQGYRGHDRFNAVNGHSRQLYAAPSGVELDVFIDRFDMCHQLDLRHRLAIDIETLPLADLVLTKLQVAELTEKDVRDFVALVIDHDFSEDDSGISLARLDEITSSDWGWWKTVKDNLEKVLGHLPRLALPEDGRSRAASKTEQLLEHLHGAPKTMRWRTRAIVGERIAWREEPEEKR